MKKITNLKEHMIMKRITVLMLIIGMTIALLSGCKQTDGLMESSISTIMNETASYAMDTDSEVYEADAVVFIENPDIKTDYTGETNEADTTIVFSGSSAEINSMGAQLNDGVLTISQAGVYVLSGDFDGQIMVAADQADDIQLILSDVSVRNESSSPIYIESADTVVITLADGTENWLYDGSAYTESTDEYEDEERLNGAIYAEDDLVINGDGSLVIEAVNKTGILGKDDVKIISGNIQITADRNGIKGKDLVYIESGDIVIEAGTDGIESETLIYIFGGNVSVNSVDDAIHSDMDVYMTGGVLTVSSEDDGIHSEGTLQIDGGDVTVVSSYEGLEGQYVIINDGNISINASDDGINTADGTVNESGMTQGPGMDVVGDFGLYISGGTLNVNSYGDGLDSNGNIWMSGGVVVISGPTTDREGSIDYNGSFEMTGGYLIAAGSTGMMQSPSATSSVNSLVIVFDTILSAGTEVVVTDTEDQLIMNYAPIKDFTSVQISAPNLEIGQFYTVTIDGEVFVTVEMTDTITAYGDVGTMNQPMGGHGRPGMDQQMPSDMTLPEGMTPPEGMTFPDGMDGQFDENMTPPDGMSSPGN